MFKFFRKETLRGEVFEKVTLHSAQFTIEQKAAIVLSLLRLVKTDGFLDDKDFYFFNQLIKLLQIEEHSLRFKEVYDAGPDWQMTILANFSNAQKECYIILLQGLLGIRKRRVRKNYLAQIRKVTGINSHMHKGANVDLYA